MPFINVRLATQSDIWMKDYIQGAQQAMMVANYLGQSL